MNFERLYKDKFYLYLQENFSLSPDAWKLVWNILDYVQAHAANEDEAHQMIREMVDIGLTEKEIERFAL